MIKVTAKCGGVELTAEWNKTANTIENLPPEEVINEIKYLINKEISMKKNWTKELLNTMLAHPGLEVKFFVSSEEVTDFTWTAQKISEIQVTPWYWDDDADERIFTDIDEIADIFHDQSETEDLEERSKEVDKRLKDLERVILVKLSA